MKTLHLHKHRSPTGFLRTGLKRALLVQRGDSKIDKEADDLVAKLYQSDQFTLEQAYKDFAHIPLKSR